MRNDYLMHRDHKYIDRKMVKGKWQYIYDKSGLGLRKKAKDSLAEYNTATTKYEYYADKYTKARDQAIAEGRNPKSLKSEMRAMNSAQQRKHIAEEQYKKNMADYSKTPLYKCEKFVLKGQQHIKDLISGKTVSKSAPAKSERPRAREKNVTNNGTGVQKGDKVDARFRIRRR